MPDSTSTERAIGRLEGKVDALLDESKRASDSRAAVYQRLESVERDVRDAKDDLQEVKPFIERARKWEQRGIGAIAAAGMIASSLTVGMTALIAYWQDIVRWFKSL